MSKDIRSFFAPVGRQTSSSKETKPQKKKRIFNIDDSDEEDSDLSRHISKKTKIEPETSKSEKKKTPSPKKPVDLNNFFGKSPIQQKAQTLIKPKSNEEPPPEKVESKRRSTKKGKKKGASTALEDHFDDDFEATLCLLDEEQLGLTPDKKSNQQNENSAGHGSSEKIKNGGDAKIENEHKKITPVKIKDKDAKSINVTPKNENKKVTPERIKGDHAHSIKVTPKNEKKKVTPEKIENNADSVKVTPKSKAPIDQPQVNSDQKKKTNAEAYQRFLNRSGPKNPGSKPIPEGSPDCLKGKTFVISGVLDSLDREEAADLIKKCGGKTTTSVSKKTSYIVLGEEPGASKLSKAEQYGVPQLTEDGLLDLIRDLSKGKTKKSEIGEKSDYFQGKRKEVTEEDETHSKKRKKEESSKKATAPRVPPVADSSSSSGIGSSISSIESQLSDDKRLDCPKKNAAIADSAENVANLGDHLWVDKYKPKSTKNIIGQTGDMSNVKKLTKWLTNWHKHHGKSEKKKAARPAPWVQGDSGSYFKAALLSGPPGVGKTTSAHLVCKELGFDIIEFNASDTRSKKLLHEHVGELLASKSIRNFYSDGDNKDSKCPKHALLMDEVDGMAGNEDRGGIQELIQLIKNSRVPIICMCNDRSHPKMRSLVNYCFDLRFHRPRIEQIKGAMMSICFKEGIKIPPDALVDIISSANQDVRQVLHNLSLWAVKDKSLTVEQTKIDAAKAKKSLKMGPWDVARQVFSLSEQEKTTFREKEELFFQDYSLGPLFVQDTYINVKPYKAGNDKRKTLECLARAADSLTHGDVVERTIRSQNAWNLLPVQAIFSSVLPGFEMAGHVKGQITFPVWLGKNSKRGRIDRLLQELHVHTRLNTSGSKMAVNLDYCYMLRDAIVRPLASLGLDGIPASLEILKKYQLLREDIDSLVELSQWPDRKDPYAAVDSKVKAAFTRAYNKECPATSYSTSMSVKKSKTGDAETEEGLGEDDAAGPEEEEETDDIAADAMIKKGKPKKQATKRKDDAPNSGKKAKKASSKK